MPQDWNYGTDRLGNCKHGTRCGWEGFERYGLISSVNERTAGVFSLE